MASLAEKYVFERLAMLEKEHDEHLKGTSATTEKEPEETDGVEFKKEPITAVRYTTCGSWCFEETDYGMGDIDALKGALELDDGGGYTHGLQRNIAVVLLALRLFKGRKLSLSINLLIREALKSKSTQLKIIHSISSTILAVSRVTVDIVLLSKMTAQKKKQSQILWYLSNVPLTA